jgi:hypothetical protein
VLQAISGSAPHNTQYLSTVGRPGRAEWIDRCGASSRSGEEDGERLPWRADSCRLTPDQLTTFD